MPDLNSFVPFLRTNRNILFFLFQRPLAGYFCFNNDDISFYLPQKNVEDSKGVIYSVSRRKGWKGERGKIMLENWIFIFSPHIDIHTTYKYAISVITFISEIDNVNLPEPSHVEFHCVNKFKSDWNTFIVIFWLFCL